MHRSRPLAVVTAALLTLTACTSTPAAEQTTAVTTAPAQLRATDITTMDDGITWARSLTTTVTSSEMTAGITTISDLLPDQDIWFATNNEIGRELLTLNSEVLANPDDAGTKVDDLQSIVDDIEEAIAHGNTP